ncbi:hypothetical protein ACFPOE_13705 [Caenimonas terrae]|uniref:Uncharacterized protein n=1 Tax=Caenimonas terrae TaxID=696074 RepID=A0ABW0NF32_9BURK
MRLLISALLFSATAALAQSPASVRGMEGALLKGDGVAATTYAAAARGEQLGEKDRSYVTCVEGRLGRPVSTDQGLPPFTARVLNAYQLYWQQSLLNPPARAGYEMALASRLAELLGQADRDFSGLEDQLRSRLASDGFYSLMGVTPPLRELMLWRTQSARSFQVALPEQDYESRVVMLDDFASLGWAGWATCGNRSTGGWATESTLYAVMPRYPGGVGSNAFLAVLLTHETQHFADKNRFQKLQPWELEYRAKLAELWAADDATAADRLGSFVDSQSDDPSLAHPYANARVLTGLAGLLRASPLGVGRSALREAARTLLARDTAARGGPRPAAEAGSPR